MVRRNVNPAYRTDPSRTMVAPPRRPRGSPGSFPSTARAGRGVRRALAAGGSTAASPRGRRSKGGIVIRPTHVRVERAGTPPARLGDPRLRLLAGEVDLDERGNRQRFAADSVGASGTSSQSSFTTVALRLCRWPMKCQRKRVAVDVRASPRDPARGSRRRPRFRPRRARPGRRPRRTWSRRRSSPPGRPRRGCARSRSRISQATRAMHSLPPRAACRRGGARRRARRDTPCRGRRGRRARSRPRATPARRRSRGRAFRRARGRARTRGGTARRPPRPPRSSTARSPARRPRRAKPPPSACTPGDRRSRRAGRASPRAGRPAPACRRSARASAIGRQSAASASSGSPRSSVQSPSPRSPREPAWARRTSAEWCW